MKIKVQAGTSKKLKALPKEVLSVVDTKLLAGEPALDVARWIQDDAKQLQDDELYALKKLLERYRKGELRARTIERIATAQATEATHTVAKRMNAMEEMHDLCMQQRYRLDKMLMRESEMAAKGILLKDATREIEVMKTLLVDLGRLQLETGVLARAPKSYKGSITDANGQTATFEWTEEQEKLFAELEGMEHGSARSD